MVSSAFASNGLAVKWSSESVRESLYCCSWVWVYISIRTACLSSAGENDRCATSCDSACALKLADQVCKWLKYSSNTRELVNVSDPVRVAYINDGLKVLGDAIRDMKL